MKTITQFRHPAWIQPGKRAFAVLVLLLPLILTASNSAAQNHRILHHFNGSDGAAATSLLLSNGTLFGSTSSGGSFNFGTVFRINPDGSDFRVLKEFAGRDGANPSSALVLDDLTLYGTTLEGGISNRGTVFRLNTDGSDFTVLKEFTGNDGADVWRSLALAGATLYGTSYNGGGSNLGTIGKLNTDGSGFTVMKEFTDPPEGGDGSVEGCLPSGRLAISGATLYGATVGGGVQGAGVVFKINTDGTGYTVLKQGDFVDGGHFIPGVILSDNTLYGATPWGGGGIGAIFRLNTDGGGFAILKSFHPTEVYWGWSLVVSGSRVYGTGRRGGVSPDGAIFTLGINGSNFTLLEEFNAAGGFPSSLVLSDTVLYGATSSGGNSNRGTIFGITLQPPAMLQPPQSQTAEAGDTVRFRVRGEGYEPLFYEWICDGTKVLSHTTNTLLVLTNVQMAQAGGYTVVVTNLFGAVTSSPAMLNVLPPVERRLVPGIKLMGTAGSLLNLHGATGLGSELNWIPLGTVTLTSASQYWCDDTSPLPPQRFYRAQAAPDVVPTLDLHLIPALTVTGSSGQSVRVDAINTVGPTDAWFTLDTVTLTNTSQLYFDVSAPGQPQRRYRLVPMP